jgi:hypothetical protein
VVGRVKVTATFSDHSKLTSPTPTCGPRIPTSGLQTSFSHVMSMIQQACIKQGGVGRFDM